MLKFLFFSFIIFSVSAAEVEGISQPSADVALSFVRSGKLVKVSVKDGDKVNKGQVLAELDNELELSKIDQLKTDLNNDLLKRAEKAKIVQKQKDLIDLQKALNDGAGTQKEVDTAKLEILQMEFNIEGMDFEKTQISKKIQEQEILMKQSVLSSPIDGLVEKVSVEVGESVERLRETFRIVRINPLWIDVNIPLDNSKGLDIGSDLFVKFPKFVGYDEVTKKGRIIYRASVADPGSETLKFRLEIKNPELRLAGERVIVLVPDKK